VYSRATRGAFVAATIGAVVIFSAGCAASGSSTSGSGAKTGTTAQLSAQKALQLAAAHSQQVSSFSATMNIQATTASGDLTMAGAFKEQLHPTLLGEMNISGITAGGQTVPGGMSVIITPTVFYLRFPPLMQAMHVSKTWAKLPLTALGPSGANLSSLLDQAESSSPIAQTRLLSQSKDVKEVGTGVINGVAVTEYTGTYSMSQALAAMPAAERAALAQSVSASGIHSVRFTVWLDDQERTRKLVVVETGTGVSETVTMNVSGYNQPVNIQLPPAAETYTVPASALASPTP
jgi:hypothetical protein